MLRLMVADVDLPSYFVATAAVELGFFKQEGIDIELELVYGARSGPEHLRDGTLHFFGGPAYAANSNVSRLERRQALVCARAILLLVHGCSRRSRR